MLQPNLPIINDPEGSAVPADLPEITDAHVHIFPYGIFSAIWDWFDEYTWDRELRRLRASGLPQEKLEWVLKKSAVGFFGLL